MKKILFFLILITFLLPAQILPKENIQIVFPSYFEGTPNQEHLIENIIKQSANIANKTYDSYMDVVYNKSEGSEPYIVNLIFSIQEQQSQVVISMKKKQEEIQSPSLNLTGELTLETSSFIANSIFYLWSFFKGFFADSMGEGPEYVDEIPSEYIGKSIIHDFPTLQQLIPYGITIKNNGNFLIGFSWACVEFNKNFKIIDQPGRNLYESGNTSYAYGVGITPGGTIYFKPSMGRELIRIVEVLPRPQKWKVSSDIYGPFTVLPDGSVVLVNQSKNKVYKIQGKKQTELRLNASPYSMISTITVGPEGNLWIYDSIERRVKIYSSRGEYISGIIPLVNSDTYLSPFSIAVYKDQSFLLSSMGQLFCFNKNGILKWEITEIPGPISDSLPQTYYFTVDSERGLIYMTDLMGKRLIKLLDISYCKENNIKNIFEEKIIKLNKQYQENDTESEPLVEKALMYEEAGAFELAKYIWESIIDIDPFHDIANEHLEKIEIMILTQNAKKMKEKVLNLLATAGPASAKAIYNQTMILYERILNLNPMDETIKAEMKALKTRYQEIDKIESSKKVSIKISSINLTNLYPSMMHHYRNNSMGRITIKNILKKKITDVFASIFIMNYMDMPTESEHINLVSPGETKLIELFAELNQKIFDLEEDLPKQIRIEVKYKIDGVEYIISKTKGLTIYRRTALSWDDSGKLASFIMPNDEIVSNFSHHVLGETDFTKNYRLSKKFFRAMKICDALGVYGIRYIEDPDSPFSKVIGKEEIIDTVRFPRKTLMIKSGDCDDSTALLGSLLESAGIKTAIMTSPGHVFLSFNTEEPEENLWQFETVKLTAIPYKGNVWIPIETTILNEGFIKSWEKASELVKKYNNTQNLEFLPVESLRSNYPPLPLPSSNFIIIEPESIKLEQRYTASTTQIIEEIYSSTISKFEQTVNIATGRKKAKILCTIGALHARFGKADEAEKIFSECMEEFPTFTPSYINLANIYMENNKIDKSINILKKGLKKRPESLLMNLVMARCYYNEGNLNKVNKYFSKVKAKAPDLAERYSYLSEELYNRAKSPDEALPSIWTFEEE